MVKLKDKVSRATDRINYEIRNEKDELIESGRVSSDEATQLLDALEAQRDLLGDTINRLDVTEEEAKRIACEGSEYVDERFNEIFWGKELNLFIQVVQRL